MHIYVLNQNAHTQYPTSLEKMKTIGECNQWVMPPILAPIIFVVPRIT
jgi:hypothetical protein